MYEKALMPREKDHEAIKTEIRTKAVTVFVQNGYKGATMRKIAEAVDMPLATLQYYYAKKDRLYDEIVQPIMQNSAMMMKKMADPVVIDHKVSEDFIADLTHDLVNHIDRYRDGVILNMRVSHGSPYENRGNELIQGVEHMVIPAILYKIAGREIELDSYQKNYTAIIAQMVIDLMIAVALRYEKNARWVYDVLYDGVYGSYKSLERLATA